MTRPGDPMPLSVKVVICAIPAALFLWFLPAVNKWVKARIEPRPTVHALALYVECSRKPADGEQIVVLVGKAGQRHECLFAGGRGTYRAKR